MKHLASLSVAAVLALGLASVAQAAPVASFEADLLDAGSGVAGAVIDHPYHSCHGRTSGTAHPSCGTRTGGPSGGLF